MTKKAITLIKNNNNNNKNNNAIIITIIIIIIVITSIGRFLIHVQSKLRSLLVATIPDYIIL